MRGVLWGRTYLEEVDATFGADSTSLTTAKRLAEEAIEANGDQGRDDGRDGDPEEHKC